MEFLTLTLIIISIYAVYYYCKKKLSYFEELGIPYVPGRPLFGNMASTVFKTNHFSVITSEIYNKNTEAKYIGAFDFLMKPTVLLRDPELIKTVTIKHFENFPDHATFIDDTVDPLMGGNLFSMRGEKWKETRSLLSPAFTSSKMKSMFELMVTCANNYVDFLSKRKTEDNRMVDTKNLFARFTNDAIGTCVFGIEVDSLNHPENDFYVLGKKAATVDGLFTLKFFLSRAIPMILKIFNIKFVDDHIARFFKNIVGTTVATRDEKGITRPDMIQLMMEARNKGTKHLKLDTTEMTAQAFIFFFGGFDTTSNQMCLVAHELALNPDIQARLQDEIDEVLRITGGKPTYEKINEMPYLDAVFNETMRRHPQIPLLDRYCIKEFELPPALPGLEPFKVKPGSYVWISPSAVHQDPKYYENPKKFDPDRYYNKKVSINDVANLGFGIGPRACIGNRFAIMETKILFFHMLAKFSLKPNEKTKPLTKYNPNTFTAAPMEGFWLSIVPRN